MKNALIWFRMDLRLRDNPAFYHAIKQAASQKIYALYVLSPSELQAHVVSARKLDFMLRNLALISDTLWTEYRIPLLFRTATSAAEVPGIVAEECRRLSVANLHFNNEYEVDEIRRDLKIVDLLAKAGVSTYRYDDQVVVKPGALRSKSSDSVYCVYSPFKNAWFDLVKTHKAQHLTLFDTKSAFVNADEFDERPSQVPESVTGFELSTEERSKMAKLYPAGEKAAHEQLEIFANSKRMLMYKAQRDIPKLDGTSGLSPYLASGVLSPKQCVVRAMQANNGKLDSGSEGIIVWIQEIIWRDFYRHILFAYPRVCMNKPFKLNTMTLPWRTDAKESEAFINGKTGYPIVDAGMRQLKETGWMHNRVRMIVASFLSKHLLHHWMEGERVFNENLIDCDFASNNGGWQWAASTGTDSQPYFRVFNPLLQSKKFDPNGDYIKKYVPELRSLTKLEAIHDPESVLGKEGLKKIGYPGRIVQHEFARKRAIEAFKSNSGAEPDEAAQARYGGAAQKGIKRKIAD